MELSQVKNFLIGGLICLVVALIVGFEPVQRVVNEAANEGTLRGVETCMSYSETDLLSSEAIRATCVNAFQKRLYRGDYATGRAGPRITQGVAGWGGVLENKTSDHVTTWVQISISIFDDEGAEQEYFAETSIWIDPFSEADFLVELTDIEPEQFEGIEFCEHDDSAPTACVAWGVTSVMGLSI